MNGIKPLNKRYGITKEVIMNKIINCADCKYGIDVNTSGKVKLCDAPYGHKMYRISHRNTVKISLANMVLIGGWKEMKLYRVSTKYGKSPYLVSAYVEADTPKQAISIFAGSSFSESIVEG
jgi:hypothetical protein